MVKSASGVDRRLDIGEVYGEAFALIGDHWKPLVLIAVLLGAAPHVVEVLASMVTRMTPPFGIVAFVFQLAALVAALIMHGALIYCGVQALSGAAPPLAESTKIGWTVWLPLLGLSILIALGVAGGMILLVVPGLILATRWAVCIPALVIEGRGVMDSMGRSAALTKGNRLNIFLLYLMFTIAALALEVVLFLVFGGFGALASMAAHDRLALRAKLQLFNLVGMPILTVVASVISAAIQATLFRQLRDLDGSGAAPAAA